MKCDLKIQLISYCIDFCGNGSFCYLCLKIHISVDLFIKVVPGLTHFTRKFDHNTQNLHNKQIRHFIIEFS